MSELVVLQHINLDVMVFRGHSRRELFLIAVLSLVLTSFILSLTSLLFFSSTIYGFSISFPISIFVGWYLTGVFQNLKREKPPGYLWLKFLLWSDRQNIFQTSLIYQGGPWHVKRELFP